MNIVVNNNSRRALLFVFMPRRSVSACMGVIPSQVRIMRENISVVRHDVFSICLKRIRVIHEIEVAKSSKLPEHF